MYFLTANSCRKTTFRRIFSYKFGCRKKTLSDFLASSSSLRTGMLKRRPCRLCRLSVIFFTCINFLVKCFAVAIWPVTGKGFQNTEWLAVLYSQYISQSTQWQRKNTENSILFLYINAKLRLPCTKKLFCFIITSTR